MAEVTYNDYKTSTAWTTAGGTGSGDIITPAPTSNTVSANQWYSWDNTDYIQDVLDGVVSNEGMNHPCTNTGADSFRFFTRDTGTDGQRPEQLVDWTAVTGGVPLLTLLGVG